MCMWMQATLKQSGLPSTCLYPWAFYENFMKPILQYRKQTDGSIAAISPFKSEQYRQWHSADAIGSAVSGAGLILSILKRIPCGKPFCRATSIQRHCIIDIACFRTIAMPAMCAEMSKHCLLRHNGINAAQLCFMISL